MMESMFSLVLSVAVLLAGAAHANLTFQYDTATQHTAGFVYTQDATALACFANSRSILPAFTYGTDSSSTSGIDGVTTAGTPEVHCGNAAGRVTNLYSDRLWAIDRFGQGSCVDLWQSATQSATAVDADLFTALRPNNTGDVNNTPFELIIQRSATACRYDANRNNDATAAKAAKNEAASPMIAWRQDQWMVHQFKFTQSKAQFDPASPRFTFTAGVADAADWTNPPASSAASQPFTASCQAQSNKTCALGSTDPSTCSLDADQVACATSVELLARSGRNGMEWKPNNVWPLGETQQLGLIHDLFGDAATNTTGFIADYRALVSTRLSRFSWLEDAVPESPFDAVTVQQGLSYPVFGNDVQSVTMVNAQNSYLVRGSAVRSSASSFLIAGGITPSLAQTAMFNLSFTVGFSETETDSSILYLSVPNTNLDATAYHVWLSIKSTYEFTVTWSCTSRQTDGDDAAFYPYRYNCDKTYEEATTDGMTFNNDNNKYPAVKRQFRNETSFPVESVFSDVVVYSNPVYAGFYDSKTLKGRATAIMKPAVDGVPFEDANVRTGAQNFRFAGASTSAQEKTSTGFVLIGVASIFIAIFMPIACCVCGKAKAGRGSDAASTADIDLVFSKATPTSTTKTAV